MRLYNTAECLALPSRYEGFPSVVGEAMACGTPVAAARVGGAGELIVHDETGWLFSAEDIEAFTRVLAFVMTHPQAVAAMRPRVRTLAEVRVSAGVVGAALQRCLSAVGILHRSLASRVPPGIALVFLVISGVLPILSN